MKPHISATAFNQLNAIARLGAPSRLSSKNRAWFLAEYATDLALYQDSRKTRDVFAIEIHR